MKTTIEIPEPLFSRIEAAAEGRGMSIEEAITDALERALPEPRPAADPNRTGYRLGEPLIHTRSGRQLDLSEFDFDDLLA